MLLQKGIVLPLEGIKPLVTNEIKGLEPIPLMGIEPIGVIGGELERDPETGLIKQVTGRPHRVHERDIPKGGEPVSEGD